MKLSIIIPYYEVYDLIIKLLDVLIPLYYYNIRENSLVRSINK